MKFSRNIIMKIMKLMIYLTYKYYYVRILETNTRNYNETLSSKSNLY